MVDVWPLNHPDVPGFTWSRRDGFLASRIDLEECPYSWFSFVSSADILSCSYSEHSAIYLEYFYSRGGGLFLIIFLAAAFFFFACWVGGG